MGRLFGTDGVRGIANRELTPELALRLGRAAARELTADGRRPRFVIGRDTRISGDMLECALAAGITSAGADVIRLGVIPTPGVAWLVRHLQADAGAMISASHNPVPDNGIKFFDENGYKLSDEVEDHITAFLEDEPSDPPVGTEVGIISDEPDAWKAYARFLQDTVDRNLFRGLRVVADLAHGAASRVAPEVFRSLGADVIYLHETADGARINVGCGSTHPDDMRRAIQEHKAQAGLAYDGDADRVLFADEQGNLVDGDHIMAICGLDLLDKGALPNRTIAATVYSNLGLIEAFRNRGGQVSITPNGDRYVLEALREKGLVLGGEQSGHIIFLNHNSTGDGILTSLQLLATMAGKGQPLSVLAGQMRPYPQVIRSVRVARKDDLPASAAVHTAIRQAEKSLGDQGRIFVRASGTEPLIRVMVEGPSADLITELADMVSGVVENELK